MKLSDPSYGAVMMLAVVPTAFAQSMTGTVENRTTDACVARVRPYTEVRAKGPSAIRLKRVDGSRLTMVGVEHSRDPDHPQFARIAASYAAAKPSILFYEGVDRGIATTADAAIRDMGESGYVRFLAKSSGVEIHRLEPSPVEEARALATDFPGDRIMLFLILREAVRLRDRESKSGETIDAAVSAILVRSGPLARAAKIVTTIHDLDTLSDAAAREWPGRDWRTLPDGWFVPKTGSGSQFTNLINAADSNFRDRHMVKLIADATAGGARVFVAIGRDHVPAQAPALRCLIEGR